MEATSPGRGFGWRRWLALAVAPASLIPLTLLIYQGYVEGGQGGEFFPIIFLIIVGLIYLFAAVAGLIAWILLLALPPPHRAGIVVAALALPMALLGALAAGSWEDRLYVAFLAAVMTLPVSLTWCAVAGVGWREGAERA